MFFGFAIELALRKWLFLLIGALLGLCLANALLSTMQSFQSNAYIAFQATPEQAGIRAVQPDRFVKTAGQYLLAEQLMAKAAATQGVDMTADRLRNAVTLTGGAADDVMQLTVSGDTPEQATARLKALLVAISEQRSTQFTTQALWIAPPSARLSRGQVVVAGVFGGAMAALLGILAWGAVHRPLFGPEYAQTGDVLVVSLPGTHGGRSRAAVREDVDRLMRELYGRGRGNLRHEVMVRDLTGVDSAQRLSELLLESSHRLSEGPVTMAGSGPLSTKAVFATMIFVGVAGVTREGSVNMARQLADGTADHYLLALTTRRWR